jgi:hypothetical protein
LPSNSTIASDGGGIATGPAGVTTGGCGRSAS